MRHLSFIGILLVAVAFAGCSGDLPTAANDAESVAFSKGDNGAQIFRGLSGEEGMIMVDEKKDLMLVAYGNDVMAEAIFELYGVYFDLPAADVQSELMTVTNPSNGSGMWRFRGTTALAIYDYDQTLVFPPPEPIDMSQYPLVAYGIVEAYTETGNDLWFGADRTLTFGLSTKGVLQNAMGPGEVSLHANARGMYRASDIHNGIFNALQRNTNIRLSPDPRG